MALGIQREKISFFYNPESLFVGSMIKSRGGQTQINVEVVKLSDFLMNDNFDLVKIDVEGHEKYIIENLFLENVIVNSNAYILEYHNNIDDHKNSLKTIIDVFETNNFIYTIQSQHSSKGFFQDINIRFYKIKK